MMKSIKLVLCLLSLGLVLPKYSEAHPVAQGAMEITVQPEQIALTARVSEEEVLVASMGNSEQNSIEAVRSAHADYLLKHLFLTCDGQPLSGSLAPGPQGVVQGASVEYRFNFPLVGAVKSIELKQNVLNELIYAPGNPWEATYQTRWITENGTVDHLLTSREPVRFELAEKADLMTLLKEYFVHGVFHILTGYDHLLFVTALVLAVGSFWELVKVLSAFTLAHTVTLTLSVLDIVRLPSEIVEPIIAASIVFVAVQNVVRPSSSHGNLRLALAFFFGLFHGLGFAGGLLDAMQGMTDANLGLSIAAFSVGVEVGHLAVVVPLYFALRIAGFLAARQDKSFSVQGFAMRYGSILISIAGVYYFFTALAI